MESSRTARTNVLIKIVEASIELDSLSVLSGSAGNKDLLGAMLLMLTLDYMRGEWEQCWQRAEEARQVGGEEDHPIAIAAQHLQSLVLAGRGHFGDVR